MAMSSDPQAGFVGHRVADEAIYNNREYYDNPKEYFGVVLDEIAKELEQPASLLDVGCANGAFLYHARKRFAGAQLTGLEPIEPLLTRAREGVQNVRAFQGGLFDQAADSDVGTSGAVTMLGVMGIFAEPDRVVARLLSFATSPGVVVMFSPFNEEPIDVLLHYRRAPAGAWETGHNLFSQATMASICENLGVSCRWVDFAMSKSIPKTADPMRSWTEPFRGNPHHLVYGTNMFSTMKLLVIRKP